MASDPVPAQARALARALWGEGWQVAWRADAADAAQRAVIVAADAAAGPPAGAVLHLPRGTGHDAPLGLAIAAHAAAHRRFGGPPMSRAGLKPVQQALLGALEDARVEWLALRELPGLRALWWPWHAAALDQARGTGFDDLLARLAAALFDPAHPEPHAWVAQVRGRFFGPDGGLALTTPAALREAASVLGHGIGQMRLPFDARQHTVAARYRDDNSHLWRPDETPVREQASLTADAAPPEAAAPPARRAADADAAAPPAAVYPEWDHRIQRQRPDWCRVYGDPPRSVAPLAWPTAAARGLRRRLSGLGRQPRPGAARAAEGDEPHAAALVESRLDRRAGRSPDGRLYRQPWRPAPPLAVLLLLDASASTRGEPLARLQQAALATTLALRDLGHRSALWAFSSQGRHRIDMPCLLDWDQQRPALPALQAGGSTRMGAAVRHALQLHALDQRRHPGWRRRVLLLTDGELHDVDVHDPAYLPADLQHAVRDAAAAGVGLRAWVVAPGRPQALAGALGPRRWRWRSSSAGWPADLAALLAEAGP